MNFLDYIPGGRLIQGLIVAALIGCVVAVYMGWAHHERDIGRAEVQAKWDAERAKQTAAALAQSQRNAEETQRRLTAQQEVQRVHDEELARVQADAGRARAAAVSLRGQLAAFTAAGRAPGNSSTGGNGAPAATALDLLAELFSAADDRSGELAAALDASHAAGLQCVRQYDSLAPVKP